MVSLSWSRCLEPVKKQHIMAGAHIRAKLFLHNRKSPITFKDRPPSDLKTFDQAWPLIGSTMSQLCHHTLIGGDISDTSVHPLRKLAQHIHSHSHGRCSALRQKGLGRNPSFAAPLLVLSTDAKQAPRPPSSLYPQGHSVLGICGKQGSYLWAAW